jgi:hypothetical protein
VLDGYWHWQAGKALRVPGKNRGKVDLQAGCLIHEQYEEKGRK